MGKVGLMWSTKDWYCEWRGICWGKGGGGQVGSDILMNAGIDLTVAGLEEVRRGQVGSAI